MSVFAQLRFLLTIAGSHGILRRYFVVNGFDGALTMLGLNMGFFVSQDVQPSIALNACLGAAVALTISGLSSAYISEAAERKRWLTELQDAMVTDLDESAHRKAAHIVPLLVALVNSLAPLLFSLIIIAPLWLGKAGFPLPLAPVDSAIAMAFMVTFGLGVFLGRVGGGFWLWSGLQALLVACVTATIILLLET